MTDVTHDLATLIVESHPSEEARDRARDGLLDFIAVTLPVLRGEARDSGLESLRKVWQAKDAQTRALLLGYAGHALDYDDFHPDFRGHPGTVILPTLLALAEESHPNTDGLLDAYIIGVEVAGRLGLAAGQQHYKRGFHSTGTLGTLAAAAAAARLIGADVAQTAIILGLAATQASGLRAQFGSAVKPLHAGLAAQAAVISARLVQAGLSGQARGVIEGFLAACCGENAHGERLTQNWGAPWRIISPGLEFKPYATCGGTHSAADAARRLHQQWITQHGGTVQQLVAAIEHIEVAFPPGGDIAASVTRPKTGIEARFSLEYVIASCLLYDNVALEDVAEGPVNPTIAALASKVQRCPDNSAPPDEIDPTRRFHQVTLFFHDAPPLLCRVTRQQSVAEPVDLQAKLRRCLSGATKEEIEQIATLCQLNTPQAISELNRLLNEQDPP
ncbi:immunity protein [[Pantoea] beijingensis]|uniref:Immunity protein n=1 Tax=[Pantoea] beijingensis TaxID=1324864 RepID=A0A443IAE7_9GAMM|nr:MULTISPECIES: MmgE/PrpD family protein [Erwiniaceae]RWR00960.1 immunity protein [[Pantoea] beijingensis]